LVGVAVKVTLVPAQIVLPGLAAILTDGTTVPVTIMVISLDVAVGVARQLALLVITQLTTSPFTNVALEYVLLLVPTLLPFSFH